MSACIGIVDRNVVVPDCVCFFLMPMGKDTMMWRFFNGPRGNGYNAALFKFLAGVVLGIDIYSRVTLFCGTRRSGHRYDFECRPLRIS